MPWVESLSPSFVARHESADADEVAATLEDLERLRDRLERLLPGTPGDVTVVFHAAPARLDLARPALPLTRHLDAPAARRYRVGAVASGRIDVLGPAALRDRASGVPDSPAMLRRAPQALYARLALAGANPTLPPPATPRRALVGLRWGWLLEGSAAWLGGQVEHARPALARRLREGPAPAFPPARPDAALLGGTVFDLLAREAGTRAAVALARRPLPADPRALLEDAFARRPLRHTEQAWRAHLERLAGRG